MITNNQLNNSRRLSAGIIGLGVGEQHIHGYEKNKNCTVFHIMNQKDSIEGAISVSFPDFIFRKSPADSGSTRFI